MVDSDPPSPAHFSMAGNFSAEDIQELLGAMTEDHHRPATCESHSASSVASVERPAEGAVDETCIGDGVKVEARSERKRSREKQRRTDVNKQFADLTIVLRQIEAEESEEESKTRLAFSPANRVDLVARTITHLERLRDSNKRRKTELDSLQQQLDQAKKAGEDTAAKLKEAMFNQPPQNKQVMMMVPMMVSADGSTSCGGGPTGMPMMNGMMNGMMNPFMMPQPFMTPQMPAPAQQAPVAAASTTAQPPQQPAMQQQAHAQMQLASMFPGFAMAPQVAATDMTQPQQQPQTAMQAMQQHQQHQRPIQQHPMSFLMPQNHHAPQQPTAPAAPPTAAPLNGSTSGNDPNTTNEQKSSPSQQGMQGGSNLAHCA